MGMTVKQSTDQIPFVDLSAQYEAIAGEIEQAISGVLRRTDFILGGDVEQFEREFAEYSETSFAVGIDSGTSAIEMALRAYGIGPGDEVITVANSFIATALAISYTGARPVLVDVDPRTYNMDPSLLEGAITPRTKAVVPVHLYGQPVDMEPVLEIAGEKGLVVIEDACQAHGARYNGKRVGSLGHAAAFSFYPGKNLGAYGDGGLVVTNDEQTADSLRMLRNYGQRQKYHHLLQGFNRRLDTLQAAVLRVKLPYLDGWNAARRRHAAQYNELLESAGVGLPFEPGYSESVYHLYVIRVADRDGLAAHLKERGVSAGIHYPVPIHLQPAYSELGYSAGSFPVSEQAAHEILSLPMYAELTEGQIEHVAEAVREFVQRA
jgi:dTDP-4-amino-4,6-dideoxygalactose transaminase